jgi:hypothetical protein
MKNKTTGSEQISNAGSFNTEFESLKEQGASAPLFYPGKFAENH